jgi:hypothetical protein
VRAPDLPRALHGFCRNQKMKKRLKGCNVELDQERHPRVG